MGRFLEYLNTKGKLDNKPAVKVVADEVDVPKDRRNQPPKGVGMKDNMQPYVGDNGKVQRGTTKALGEQGDSKLYYDVTKKPQAAKIPTAEANHLELFAMVREELAQNPGLAEHLIGDLRRHGLLSILVSELSTHNETYKHFAQLMGDKEYGPDVCRKLVRAVREEVTPLNKDDQEVGPTNKLADGGDNEDPSLNDDDDDADEHGGDSDDDVTPDVKNVQGIGDDEHADDDELAIGGDEDDDASNDQLPPWVTQMAGGPGKEKAHGHHHAANPLMGQPAVEHLQQAMRNLKLL